MKNLFKKSLLAVILFVCAIALASCGNVTIPEDDDEEANPYINIIVARTADKDNATYKKIVEAFQTQIVAEYMLTKFNEAYFPAFDYTSFTKEQGEATVKLIDEYERKSEGKQIVKIGVCGASNDQWYAAQYVLDQENAGIYLELITFSQYTLPNEALANGEIDLNSFQHYAYLKNEIASQGYDLTVIGESLMAPLTLYSKAYKSLDELKTAAEKAEVVIAIPNDTTNGGRAIKLLEKAGLLEVDPAAGYTPDTVDITKYNYNIKIVQQAANTLPEVLSSYGAVIVNGTYAIPAGLIPSQDGLIIEVQNN